MMSEISKSLFEKTLFCIQPNVLILKTSKTYLETITQRVYKDEFSLVSEGLLVGF